MSRKLSTEPENRPWSRIGFRKYSAGNPAPLPRKIVSSPVDGFPLSRGAPQRAIFAAFLVGRRRSVHQFVHRLADQILRPARPAGGPPRDWQNGPARSDPRRRCRRPPIQQNLLLPAQFLGALPFARPGQHLPQRSGHRLHGRRGLAIFAQLAVAVELQHRQHMIAHLHRRGPARNHLVRMAACMRGLGGGAARSDAHTSRPSFHARPGRLPPGASVIPMLSWISAFRFFARNAPCGAEFKPVFFRVDVPLHRDVPALRNAQRLQHPHGRHLGRDVFAHDLAHQQLQCQAMLALLLLRHIANQALHGHRLACPAPLMQAHLQLLHMAVGCFVANRSAIDRFAIQRLLQQRRYFFAAARPEDILERVVAPGMRFCPAETSVSTRDWRRGICRAMSSVAIISLEFSNRSR